MCFAHFKGFHRRGKTKNEKGQKLYRSENKFISWVILAVFSLKNSDLLVVLFFATIHKMVAISGHIKVNQKMAFFGFEF